MLKVLSYILCDLDPKVKVIGQKSGICAGVPSTSALVVFCFCILGGGGKRGEQEIEKRRERGDRCQSELSTKSSLKS